MASVQELLLAAQARKSPFASLLEGAAQGFGQAQSQSLDRIKSMVALENDRQDRERAAEAHKELMAQIAGAQETKTRSDFNGVGAQAKPAQPGLRLAGASVGAKGYLTPKFETVEPKPAGSLDSMLAQRVQRGDMTLEQALEMKSRGQGASPSLAYQKEKDVEKRRTELKELQIPGFELGQDVRPTTKEAQDLRSSSGALQDFSKGVNRMVELISKHGSTKLTGEVSGEMETLAANLKLTLKEVQKLGVLSASDIAFLEAQIFDPSKVQSLATRTPTAIKQLETARSRAESLLSEALKARGYSPKSAKQEGGAGDIKIVGVRKK